MIREEETVLMVAPKWPSQPWFLDLLETQTGLPWAVQLRKDLLSQARGLIWHPNLELWDLPVWLLSGARQ